MIRINQMSIKDLYPQIEEKLKKLKDITKDDLMKENIEEILNKAPTDYYTNNGNNIKHYLRSFDTLAKNATYMEKCSEEERQIIYEIAKDTKLASCNVNSDINKIEDNKPKTRLPNTEFDVTSMYGKKEEE